MVDDTRRLDAEYAGKRDTLREAEAGMQFRPVEPERLDLDTNPASRCSRHRNFPYTQGFRRPGGVEDDRAHGGWHISHAIGCRR
jgi:hypothetical protein